jgi:hypothetical protein
MKIAGVMFYGIEHLTHSQVGKPSAFAEITSCIRDNEMDILLFLTALLLVTGRVWTVLLIVPAKHTVSCRIAASLLPFGVAFVALITFGFGLLVSGAMLRGIIALACLATVQLELSEDVGKAPRSSTLQLRGQKHSYSSLFWLCKRQS